MKDLAQFKDYLNNMSNNILVNNMVNISINLNKNMKYIAPPNQKQ
jgi:hypothetical protein